MLGTYLVVVNVLHRGSSEFGVHCGTAVLTVIGVRVVNVGKLYGSLVVYTGCFVVDGTGLVVVSGANVAVVTG